MYDYDDIEDYLHQRMSESDRLAFEQALADDAQLAIRLDVLKAESKFFDLLHEEHLMAQFKSWELEKKDNPIPHAPGESTLMRPNAISYIWKITASIIVLAALWYMYKINYPLPETPVTPPSPIAENGNLIEADSITRNISTHPNAIPGIKNAPAPLQKANYDTNLMAALAYRPMEADGQQMGNEGNSATSDELEEAVHLYGQKRYEDALALLQKTDPNRIHEYLYLRGHTYIQLAQFALAEEDFQQLRNLNTDRSEDADRLIVFCAIKRLPESHKHLDSVLQRIILQQPVHDFSGKAKKIKSMLEKQ